jgi:hypothetical protein
MGVLKRIDHIKWMEGFINRPYFVVELTATEPNDYLYHEEFDSNGTLYWAICQDSVSFMYHNPRMEGGYGGREFQIRLARLDGSFHTIRGPWSSRAGVLNNYPNIPNVVDVATTDHWACAVTADALTRVAKAQGIKLVWVRSGGEWTIEPLQQDGSIKYDPQMANWDIEEVV